MRWKDTLPLLVVDPELSGAAYHLVAALRDSTEAFRPHHASMAAAHIRAVRKSIEAEHGITSQRVLDWSPSASAERILWGALYRASEAAYFGHDPHLSASCCRAAEAALRTLWKRVQA